MALLLPSGHSSPNLQVPLILKCFAYLETREFVIASNEQCTAFPHYSPVQTLAWCELRGPAAGNGSSWVSLSTSTGFLLVPPSPSSFSGERGPAPWPHQPFLCDRATGGGFFAEQKAVFKSHLATFSNYSAMHIAL